MAAGDESLIKDIYQDGKLQAETVPTGHKNCNQISFDVRRHKGLGRCHPGQWRRV